MTTQALHSPPNPRRHLRTAAAVLVAGVCAAAAAAQSPLAPQLEFPTLPLHQLHPGIQADAYDNPAISQTVGEHLAQVMGLLNEGRYGAAETLLKPLLEQNRLFTLSPFETSRVFLLAHTLHMQTRNLPAAIAALQAALAAGAMTRLESAQMELNLAQLYIMTERHADAVASLQEWQRKNVGKASRVSYQLLAQAQLALGDTTAATSAMETALALPHADSAEMEWEYRKIVDFYLATGQHAKARSTLERMLTRFGESVTYREQLRVLAEAAGP